MPKAPRTLDDLVAKDPLSQGLKASQQHSLTIGAPQAAAHYERLASQRASTLASKLPPPAAPQAPKEPTAAQLVRQQNAATKQENTATRRQFQNDAVAWFTTAEGKHIPITAPSGGRLVKKDQTPYYYDEKTGQPYRVIGNKAVGVNELGAVSRKAKPDGLVYEHLAQTNSSKDVPVDVNEQNPPGMKEFEQGLKEDQEQVTKGVVSANASVTAHSKAVTQAKQDLAVMNKIGAGDDPVHAALVEKYGQNPATEHDESSGEYTPTEPTDPEELAKKRLGDIYTLAKEQKAQAIIALNTAQAAKDSFFAKKTERLATAREGFAYEARERLPGTGRLATAANDQIIGVVPPPPLPVTKEDALDPVRAAAQAAIRTVTDVSGLNQRVDKDALHFDFRGMPTLPPLHIKTPTSATDSAPDSEIDTDTAPAPEAPIAYSTSVPDTALLPRAAELQSYAKAAGKTDFHATPGLQMQDDGKLMVDMEPPAPAEEAPAPSYPEKLLNMANDAVTKAQMAPFGAAAGYVQDGIKALGEGITKAFDPKTGKPSLVPTERGQRVYDQYGIPSLEMHWQGSEKPGAPVSPSLLANDPYHGLPEYAAAPRDLFPAPDSPSLKGMSEEEIAKAREDVTNQWRANRWEPTKTADFLTRWKAGDDAARREMMAEVDSRQNDLRPELRRLDTKMLWETGQISKQEARTLENIETQRLPGLPDLDMQWAVKGDKNADGPARQKFIEQYLRDNRNTVDFDDATFTAQRDKLLAGVPSDLISDAGQWMKNTTAGALGSSPGMLIDQPVNILVAGAHAVVGALQGKPLSGGQKDLLAEDNKRMGLIAGQTGDSLYNMYAQTRERLRTLTPDGVNRFDEMRQDLAGILADIDNGKRPTEAEFQAVRNRIADRALVVNGVADKSIPQERARAYYDIGNLNSRVGGIFAQYNETRDPNLKDQMITELLAHPGEMQRRDQASQYADPTIAKESWLRTIGEAEEADKLARDRSGFINQITSGYRSGGVAPLTETAVEMASAGLEGWFAKAAERGLGLAEKATMETGRKMAAGEAFEHWWEKLGIKHAAEDAPLTLGDKARNLAVSAAKSAGGVSLTEGAEEIVGGFGQKENTDKDIAMQGLGGAFGGLALMPFFHGQHLVSTGVASGLNAASSFLDNRRQVLADKAAVAKIVETHNRLNPSDPIDFDLAQQARAYLPSHEVVTGAINAATQQMMNAAALPEGPVRDKALQKANDLWHSTFNFQFQNEQAALNAAKEINGLKDQGPEGEALRNVADAALRAVQDGTLTPDQSGWLANYHLPTGEKAAYYAEGTDNTARLKEINQRITELEKQRDQAKQKNKLSIGDFTGKPQTIKYDASQWNAAKSGELESLKKEAESSTNVPHGTPDKGRWIFTDAFRNAVAEVAPQTAAAFFDQTENQQLDAHQQLVNNATSGAPTDTQAAKAASRAGATPGTGANFMGVEGVPSQASSTSAPSAPQSPAARSLVVSPSSGENVGVSAPERGSAADVRASAVGNPVSSTGSYTFPLSYTSKEGLEVKNTPTIKAASLSEAKSKQQSYVAKLEKVGHTDVVAGELSPVMSKATGKQSLQVQEQEQEQQPYIALDWPQQAQSWKIETLKDLLTNVASTYGYALADTGIPTGMHDRWGKALHWGTNLYDKLGDRPPGISPQAETIGHWIDNLSNSGMKREILSRMSEGVNAGSVTGGYLHRVWFGHDALSNMGDIVSKFGVSSVPHYFMALFKDSTTKSGIPLPGVQMLVRSGAVSDKLATKWMSVTLPGMFGAGMAIYGTLRLARTLEGGKLTKTKAVLATLGVGFKVIGGALHAQPFLVLSGLADAALLITHLGDIKRVFAATSKEELNTHAAEVKQEFKQSSQSQPVANDKKNVTLKDDLYPKNHEPGRSSESSVEHVHGQDRGASDTQRGRAPLADGGTQVSNRAGQVAGTETPSALSRGNDGTLQGQSTEGSREGTAATGGLPALNSTALEQGAPQEVNAATDQEEQIPEPAIDEGGGKVVPSRTAPTNNKENSVPAVKRKDKIKLTHKNTFEALKEHFQPGEIVNDYLGKSRVISFTGTNVADWSVKVQGLTKEGEDLPNDVRTHRTFPSAKELQIALNKPPSESEAVDQRAPTNASPETVKSAKDEAYLKAAQAGDLTTAQDMVDAAAKEAGYNIPVWHGLNYGGSKEIEGHSFDFERGRYGKGAWVTTSEEVGNRYGPKNKLKLFLKADRVFTQKDYEQLPENDPIKQAIARNNAKPETLSTVIDFSEAEPLLKARGYDAAAHTRPGSMDGAPSDALHTAYFVFISPSQLKSADPIIRDGSGNIIPLSERFASGPGERREQELTGNPISTLEKQSFSGWSMVDKNGGNSGNSASDVVKFEDVPSHSLTDQQRDNLAALASIWRQDAGATGETGAFTSRRISSVADGRGRSLVEFTQAFEAATGKRIEWVDTPAELPLPWKAAVSPQRSNTIFVHSRAPGNVLALIGHEWGHTLKSQNPALYRDLQTALAKQASREDVKVLRSDLSKHYRRDILNTELTNNVIGDFFTDPEFWRQVGKEEPSLLHRVVQSLQDWFTGLVAKVKSQWGMEKYAKSLDDARQEVVAAFTQAVREGPYSELSNVSDDELVRSGITETDLAAHDAATSPHNNLPEPTQAQKEAGNYKVGRLRLGGMNISVENPAGSTRKGTDGKGKLWSREMKSHYGYFRDTQSRDGDHMDVFVKPGTSADYNGPAFVVNQIDPKTGKFDEHKTILGAQTPEEARALYLDNYDATGPSRIGSIARFSTLENFKKWATEKQRIAPAKEGMEAKRSRRLSDNAEMPTAGVSETNNHAKELAKPNLESYFNYHGLPSSEHAAAESSIRGSFAASPTPYEETAARVSSNGGVDRGAVRSARTHQAAVYQGLINGDIEGTAKSISDGVPLSSLMPQFIGREISGFDIRGAVINSPKELALHALAHRTPYFESVKVVVVDKAHQVIHSQVVHVGSLNYSVASPQSILGVVNAARMMAPNSEIGGFLVSHNHPSGDPAPSSEDVTFTKRMKQASDALNIPFIDHVITNGRKYYSFLENDKLDDSAKGTKNDSSSLGLETKHPYGELADFEAIPVEDRLKVAQPVDSASIISTLRTADPGYVHALHLDTRKGLIGVTRHSIGLLDDDLARSIVSDTQMMGAASFAISFPREDINVQATVQPVVKGVYKNLTLKQRSVVGALMRMAKLMGVSFVDAHASKIGSFYENGLMEAVAEHIAGEENVVREDGPEYTSTPSGESPFDEDPEVAKAWHASKEQEKLTDAANEWSRIRMEAGKRRVIQSEIEAGKTTQKPETGMNEGLATLGRAFFAGKFDKLEAAARGLGDLVRGNDISQHFSEAALNDYMDKVRQSVKESFGSPSYWHNRQNRARMQEFLDNLLPTAARLNAVDVEDGEFKFADFDMRAGVIFENDVNRMQAKPGDEILWKTASGIPEMLKIGSMIMEDGKPSQPGQRRFMLTRTMSESTQKTLYDHFKQEFPEGAAWLDQWIDPLLRDATQTGPGNVQVPVFNRHALLKSFNDWSPELKELFGEQPLPGVTGVEGYTPDVMAQKGLINAISAALHGNSYLNRFMSSARKFKGGELRETGNVKNLFDGFTGRAMDSQREKIRFKTRRDIIEKASKSKDKIAKENRSQYVSLDDTFKKLYEAHVIASGLDRTKFPALTQSLNPEQRSALVKLFGEMYKKYGQGLVIHKDIHRQLMLGAAMTQTENSAIKALQWIIGRRNRNMLVDLGTYAKNWTGNLIFQPVELMNRVNLAIVNGLTAPFSSTAQQEGELAARQAAELFKGFFADRRMMDLWTLNNGLGAGIGKIRPFVPQEVFSEGNNLRYDESSQNKTSWEHLKNFDVGAAFLHGIKYGNIDTHPKMSNTYRLLRADAGMVAARQKVPKDQREAFIQNWMLNAHKQHPAEFLQAFKASQSRFGDYENVPSWMDPTQSILPIDSSDTQKQIEKLLKSAICPFIRWNYNMARQSYHQSFGALVNATLGAKEGDWSKVRAEVANVMTAAALTAVGAFIVGAGGGAGDDDKELTLGTNEDAEGKSIPKQLRTSERINWSEIMRRLTGDKLGDTYATEGADHSVNDQWYRYKNDPWLPQAIILGLLARGRGADAFKASKDLGTDYFLSFGVAANLAKAVWHTSSYEATQLAVQMAEAPLIPTRLVDHISKVVDPVTRQTEPRVAFRGQPGENQKGWEDYKPGALEALKMSVPGLSKTLPAAGTLMSGEAGNFDPEAWLKSRENAIKGKFTKGALTPEQASQQSALRKELKAKKITPAEYVSKVTSPELTGTKLSKADMQDGYKQAIADARELVNNKLSPAQVAQLYTDFGIVPTPDDKKRVTSIPMVPVLKTLQDLGIGPESVGTYVTQDRLGRPVTKISAPKPDTLSVTDPKWEILKALTGTNIRPIPTGAVKAAVAKEDFYKTPWKPKRALNTQDWFSGAKK